MGEGKIRLTSEELAMSHNGLCISFGDGSCSCLVQWVKGLQEENDKLKLERRGFQVMARKMLNHGGPTIAIINGRYERAAGNAQCPQCGLELLEHPQVKDYPTFQVLCDGSVVKT